MAEVLGISFCRCEIRSTDNLPASFSESLRHFGATGKKISGKKRPENKSEEDRKPEVIIYV